MKIVEFKYRFKWSLLEQLYILAVDDVITVMLIKFSVYKLASPNCRTLSLINIITKLLNYFPCEITIVISQSLSGT